MSPRVLHGNSYMLPVAREGLPGETAIWRLSALHCDTHLGALLGLP